MQETVGQRTTYGGDNNSSDTQPSKHQEAVYGVDVVNSRGGHGTASGSHENRSTAQDPLDLATGLGEEVQRDAGTAHDAEAEGKAADANRNGIVAVDVVGLGGPEQEHREEIGARDEGNDEGQDQVPPRLAQTRGQHGLLGAVCFPETEGDEEDDAEKERHERVRA